MILKLEMPYFDRQVNRGSIIKWHKTEGDFIQYGDELFDIKVEEITKLKRVKEGQARTVDIVKGTLTGLEFTIRVISSDMGFLRKIEAQEGDVREIGDVVAAVSTSQDEDVDTNAIANAPAFRVIANVAEED